MVQVRPKVRVAFLEQSVSYFDVDLSLLVRFGSIALITMIDGGLYSVTALRKTTKKG